MNTIRLLLLSSLFLTLPVMAQRRKAPQLTPEQQAAQAKMQRMIANTQRIMFIDSMVIDKDFFLQHYRLSPEAGRVASYETIFHTRQQPHSYVYINELGTRCYLAQEAADSTIQLYTCENIDNRWTRPQALHGINDNNEFRRVNYPFMMGDGQTFYFAAEGDEGLGGYDIYVTRYDSEENLFLHPVNIGMPFNSEANDYMYVIDEYSNLGWFATDRNQPADKVCIYIFEPSQTRQTYTASGLTPAEIATFARIDRIADTWSNSSVHHAALERLQAVLNRSQEKRTDSQFHFVINDDITYNKIEDFKAPENAKRFQQLATLRYRYQRLLNTLDRARDYYATASNDERDELKPEILASEQTQHEIYLQIHLMEKTIRNTEILFLTQKR